MKQNILILALLFSAASLFAQVEFYHSYFYETEEFEMCQLSQATILDSRYGYLFPTSGVIRGLTIFVNIIYDQNDAIRERMDNLSTVYWKPDTTSSINNPNVIPTYLLYLFDTHESPTHTYNGIITRKFAEASFNSLILLSDFMVVNIYQSQITNKNSIILKNACL